MDAYKGIGFIVGVITFIGCYLYSIAAYGFLVGLGLGWLPSAIAGFVAGLLWPVIAVAALWLFGVIL